MIRISKINQKKQKKQSSKIVDRNKSCLLWMIALRQPPSWAKISIFFVTIQHSMTCYSTMYFFLVKKESPQNLVGFEFD